MKKIALIVLASLQVSSIAIAQEFTLNADQSVSTENTTKNTYQVELIEAFKTPFPVGNTTMTPDRRVFASYHPLANTDARVVELKPNGVAIPYPNSISQGQQGKHNFYLDSVLGLRSDKDGVLWMMDMGIRETNGIPKLVAWDTRHDKLVKIIAFPPPLSNKHSVFNDIAFDDKHHTIYIADEGWMNGGTGSTAALIVVDTQTGFARRILEGHMSMVPEDIDLIPNGAAPLAMTDDKGNKIPLRIGVDGLVVDKEDKWLYFAPANGNKLYRIETKYLVDNKLSESELDKHIEVFSTKKPNNGGISIDNKGNVWTTDFNKFAIGYIKPNGDYVEVIQDPQTLKWPDHISYGTDGFLYVPASQLHLAAAVNNGVSKMQAPYVTYKIKGINEGIVGR